MQWSDGYILQNDYHNKINKHNDNLTKLLFFGESI